MYDVLSDLLCITRKEAYTLLSRYPSHAEKQHEITPFECSKGDTVRNESSIIAPNYFAYRPTADCDHHPRCSNSAGSPRSQSHDGLSLRRSRGWPTSWQSRGRSTGRRRPQGWSFSIERTSDTAFRIVLAQLRCVHSSHRSALSSGPPAHSTYHALVIDRAGSRHHHRVVLDYRWHSKYSCLH